MAFQRLRPRFCILSVGTCEPQATPNARSRSAACISSRTAGRRNIGSDAVQRSPSLPARPLVMRPSGVISWRTRAALVHYALCNIVRSDSTSPPHMRWLHMLCRCAIVGRCASRARGSVSDGPSGGSPSTGRSGALFVFNIGGTCRGGRGCGISGPQPGPTKVQTWFTNPPPGLVGPWLGPPLAQPGSNQVQKSN